MSHPSHPQNDFLVQSPATARRCGINVQPVHNRIVAAMIHTSRYAFKGKARLAADCGVAPSTICRFLLGQCSPSFSLVSAVTAALEKQLGVTIDPRELVSRDGAYPTPSICALCGCKGCLPDEAYDDEERIKPEYRHLKSGQWTTLSAQCVQQVLHEDEEAR